jgi:hypothetical protein
MPLNSIKAVAFAVLLVKQGYLNEPSSPLAKWYLHHHVWSSYFETILETS